MPYADKRVSREAIKANNAAYYQRTKIAQHEDRKQRKVAFTKWVQSLKANVPCKQCGVIYPSPAMEWHHRDVMAKLMAVGTLASSGNRQRVLDEIAKCDLLCANCHRILTYPTP